MFKRLLNRIKKRIHDRLTKPLSREDRLAMMMALAKIERFTHEEAFKIINEIGKQTDQINKCSHVSGMVACAHFKPLTFAEAVQIITAVQQNTKGMFVVCHAELSMKNFAKSLNHNNRHMMN